MSLTIQNNYGQVNHIEKSVVNINPNGAMTAIPSQYDNAEDISPAEECIPQEEQSESNGANKPGPKRKSLFRDLNGNKDDACTSAEAKRVQAYIAKHHLGNAKFDSSISSKLNIVVAYFWKFWSEKGLVEHYSARGEGAAFYRFLTEDCELTCPVEEKTFIRIVRSIIEDEHIDQEIHSNVAKSFEK